MSLQANRERKARTIAKLLFAARVTVTMARAADDQMRAVCGEAARMVLETEKASPPSEETWRLVLEYLQTLWDHGSLC